MAYEHPILLAHGAGTDGVFHQVVVDLRLVVFKVSRHGPLFSEDIGDGFVHGGLGQVASMALGDGLARRAEGHGRFALVGDRKARSIVGRALVVEGKVVAILGYDDVDEQLGGGALSSPTAPP